MLKSVKTLMTVLVVRLFSFDEIRGDTVRDASEFNNDGTLVKKPKIVNGQFKLSHKHASGYRTEKWINGL